MQKHGRARVKLPGVKCRHPGASAEAEKRERNVQQRQLPTSDTCNVANKDKACCVMLRARMPCWG